MVVARFVPETFTKVVLQCFCKSCQVPNVEKKVISPPPRTSSNVVRRPPKKVAFLDFQGNIDEYASGITSTFATEVRCSEQSKGGLKYELVLSEPALEQSPKIVAQSPPKSNLSKEDIEKKLKAAEERRQSIELQKLNFVTEKLSHLNEVKGKKEEFNQNFMQAAKETLVQRHESMKENRETHIKNIQEKAREIIQKVDEKRKADDSPDKEVKLEAFNKKLMTAQEQREAILNSLQERLKEHDKHILEVRKQVEESKVNENLREKSQKKLEIAQAKRESILKEIQEKIKEHKTHVLRVRQMNELNQQDASKLQQIKQKLDIAEQKRSIQYQTMLEKLQEHERHIEEVRQKAMSVNSEENNCKENFSG